MSSRKARKRKRERRRRKYEAKREAQRKLALQLPPNRPNSAELFELIERMAHICRDTIAELENPQPKV